MFSWEKPIEDDVIEFCEHMARNMRQAESANRETGWFANNELSKSCGAAAMAYETVAEHVRDAMKFRKVT